MSQTLPEAANPPKTKKRAVEPRISFVQKVIGNETYLVMAKSAAQLDDDWTSLYFTTEAKTNLFLQPPFEPKTLLNFVATNNTLGQCVEVMEVNIDGTGYDFVSTDEDKDPNEDEVKEAKAFFDEPYPQTSFISMRRKMRRQLESIGYAYLEVLRSMDGKLVGLRNMETPNIRMVKLDQPVLAEKTLTRNGKEVKIKIWVRERRYAQLIGTNEYVYYREFGSSRKINRRTGDWETPGSPVPAEEQGTELLVFTIHPDVSTPYHVPRWINNLPSVVGSRRAEEQNLEFLDAGGLPPAIIFIQGGTLGKSTADQLRAYLSGKNKNLNRAVVVEAQSTSGSLESAGGVQVKVERFGAEKANDAMFQNYDERSAEHVRCAFRIAPLFLGKAADYNFATAMTTYMVTEAQVFSPERTEFDERINMTLMKELGFKSIKYKSNPITLKDVGNQLKGLELAKDKADGESYIKEINELVGLNLEKGEDPPIVPPGAPGVPGQPAPKLTAVKPQAAEPKKPMGEVKAPQRKTASELLDLVHDYAALKGLTRKRDFTKIEEMGVYERMNHLDTEDRAAFESLLASVTLGTDDPELIHLSRCSH